MHCTNGNHAGNVLFELNHKITTVVKNASTKPELINPTSNFW